MAIYSHSKMQTFEQCPFKFKLRYIDKIKPDLEKSIEAHLGTCVHDTLEWMYKKIKTGNIPTIDQVITYYGETWQKDYSKDIVIVRKELSAKDYFNKGVKFLLDYYTTNHPFNDGTLELEKKITIKLGEAGEYTLIGFIDRLSQNLKTGEIEIHDYKTAKTLPSQEKIDSDKQLALYSIAIKEIFGTEKKIKLVWHYLAHNQKIISERSDEQLEMLKKETIKLIKKIESTMEYPTNKTVLCNWCEYKGMCPEFGGCLKNETQKTLNLKEIKDYPTAKKYIR
jgi:putative RecB family exonuclease